MKETHAAIRPPASSGRDPVMDLTRVICVALVVVGHLLMIGASIHPASGLVITNTLLQQPWLGPVLWIAQIMPLFFVVGGFAGIRAWRSLQERGGTPADFIRSRVLRLARPAIPLFIFFTVTIVILHLSGVAPASITAMGIGVASPLWFLAAYTFAQAYLPGLAALHAIAPRLTLAALAAGAVLLDLVRFGTRLDELGILNMIFVWLFIQQIGFWAADGWFTRRSRTQLVLLAAASYGLLLALVVLRVYPGDMIENLNPPTVALMLLGIGQFSLLMLAHPLLSRLMAFRVMRGVVGTVGSRLMTIYLWHLPVIALIVGLLLLTPLPAPEPGTAAWWWTRPVILALTAAVLFGLSMLLGRFETTESARVSATAGATRATDWTVGLSTALIVLPPFTVMLFGLDFWIAAAGTLMLAAAAALQSPVQRPPERGRRTSRLRRPRSPHAPRRVRERAPRRPGPSSPS